MPGPSILMLVAVALGAQADTPPRELDPEALRALIDRQYVELPADERKQHVDALVAVFNARPRSAEERREMVTWLTRKLERGDSWASMAGRMAGAYERSTGQQKQGVPDTLGWREARGHIEYVKAGLEERFSHPIPDPATRETICSQLRSVGERLRECALRKMSGAYAGMMVDTKIKRALDGLLRDIQHGVRGGYYRPFEPWEIAQIVAEIEAVADQHPPVDASSDADRRYAEGNPIRVGDDSQAVEFLGKLFEVYWDITRFTTPKTRAAWKAYGDSLTASGDWFSSKQATPAARVHPPELPVPLLDAAKAATPEIQRQAPAPVDASRPEGPTRPNPGVRSNALIVALLLVAIALGTWLIKRGLEASRRAQ